MVSPATSTGNCGIIYIDLSSDAGRGMLSIAIPLRTAGKPMPRVDYTFNGSICSATLLQM